MYPTTKLTAVALVALAVCLPAAQQAGDSSRTASTAAQGQFSQAQLEQLVAPIALHPDALLTQILIASTYPLEIVQAQRWVDQNSGLKGSELEEALKTQEWDPSVKSMCGFPTVLKQMSENLDWTRDLGDAFLGQKTQVMDTVQMMRKKALDSGNLQTTPQQKVVQAEGTIVIEPASPEVIYVPAYSPLVVYGPGWYYPYWYYPYWYYPPPHGGGFVSFSIGFTWGAACWSYCDWHHHGVYVNTVAYHTFTTRTSSKPVAGAFVAGVADRSPGKFAWTHDPVHRKGVTYRSPQVASTYAGALGASKAPRKDAPGIDRPGTGKGARPKPPDARERPARERPKPPAKRPKPGKERKPDGLEAPQRGASRGGSSDRADKPRKQHERPR